MPKTYIALRSKQAWNVSHDLSFVMYGLNLNNEVFGEMRSGLTRPLNRLRRSLRTL